MMQAQFIQSGDSIDYKPGDYGTATDDVAAGDVVVIGDLVGVAVQPIPAGSLGSVTLRGIFEIPSFSASMATYGSKLYWDQATKTVGALSEVAAGSKFIGIAINDPSNSPHARVVLGGYCEAKPAS